jgi:hypothetical protein
MNKICECGSVNTVAKGDIKEDDLVLFLTEDDIFVLIKRQHNPKENSKLDHANTEYFEFVSMSLMNVYHDKIYDERIDAIEDVTSEGKTLYVPKNWFPKIRHELRNRIAKIEMEE